METTKEYDVVLIPSTEITDIISVTQGAGKGGLFCREYYGTAWEDMGDSYMELFFISDGKIKAGDVVLVPTVVNGEIDWKQEVKVSIAKSNYAPSPYVIKVVASQNKLLTPSSLIHKAFNLLYVDRHNKNEVITKASLETEKICVQTGNACGFPCNGECESTIKVDSENCIMIKSYR